MKKIWIYLLGVLTGIVITLIFLIIIGATSNERNGLDTKITKGMSFFDHPGDIVEPARVRVFQALDDRTALVKCIGPEGNDSIDFIADIAIADEIVALLYNEESMPYYDGQIVKSPAGKAFRQVGIYRYSTPLGNKTVPIVMLLDE